VRRLIAWTVAGLALTAAVAGAALVLAPLPESPPGPEPGRSLFHAHCATCHGPDGRGGSWRARLLLLHPGDLTAPDVAGAPDGYLADIIRQGGSSIGKPGMPSFGFTLTAAEIEALMAYLRTLPASPAPRAAGS
jgi:mono/diheme cytochrome c family protein